MKSYYQILGVSENATEQEIKKAFRELAQATHPDTHPGDKTAEARFKEANEAYETLGDTQKRKQYDEKRQNSANARPKGGRAKSQPKNPFDFAMNLGDMFSDFFTDGTTEKKEKESKKRDKNPVNADDIFSKFMGFKP